MSQEHDVSDHPHDKAELLLWVARAWDALQGAFAGLNEAQPVERRDANGWSIKDHLVNVTAWERSLLYLLHVIPRHRALGVDEQTYLTNDADGVNAIIHARERDRPLFDVLAAMDDVHRQLLETLDGMTWEDLFQPYSHYLPDEPGEDNGNPVADWVAGNTYGHYDEHREWIEALQG
jgi:hypothetical protein